MYNLSELEARTRNGDTVVLGEHNAPARVSKLLAPSAVIVVQQLAVILLIGWTSSRQNEFTLLSSLCAAKRRAGICRPMKVTVRIRVSTARDEQEWQGHWR
jgi:hypothetical protein